MCLIEGVSQNDVDSGSPHDITAELSVIVMLPGSGESENTL